jgi:hypothetical protein
MADINMKRWQLELVGGILLILAIFLFCRLQTTIEVVLALTIAWASSQLLSQNRNR